MEKSIIIVGAGMAGLSAGCYARMNGYKTAIFEMNKVPGGLCAAWHKRGYTFDISMHMLTGSVSGPFHQMWDELGITGKFKFHFHDHLTQIEGMGKKLRLPVDRIKFEEAMMAISPSDEKYIKELIHILFGPDLMKAATLNAGEHNFVDRLKSIPTILPLIGYFRKYNKTSLQQFAENFKDPFLQTAVRMMVDSPGWPMPDFPMIALIGFIKGGVTEAGAPLGGSQKVAFHLADLFRKTGGKINYNSRVTNLIIENNRVSGIKLDDGSERRADVVIWAGDGHTLHFDILKQQYLDDKIRKMYDTWIPVKPIVHVMMGVNMDLSREPHSLLLELDEPITIAGQEHKWMSLINHSFDPSMAPEGKSELEAWFATDFDYWEKLASNRHEYEKEKQRIANHVIRQLEKRWPGFITRLEVTDVPTPVTYKRYTGNWKGSPDGWYITTQNYNVMEPNRTIQGLEGIYMAGQWTSPFTGTVIAALSGRQVIQVICRKDGRKFASRIPAEPKEVMAH